MYNVNILSLPLVPRLFFCRRLKGKLKKAFQTDESEVLAYFTHPWTHVLYKIFNAKILKEIHSFIDNATEAIIGTM
jgi:hypothetical protein